MANIAPDEFYVFIEVPKGSNIKIEYDEKLNGLRVDRILYTATFYPFNYGFIPGTLGEDGDPLDCIVVSFEPLPHGVYIRSRPIGVLLTRDEKGIDWKVIAVPHQTVDNKFKNVNRLEDLPPGVMEQIMHFFQHYKELEEGKWVKVEGYMGVDDAKKVIAKAIDRATGK